ncbi:MAG: glycine/sarcosine/betaine reductase selenoprotein B family protein [Chloroflexota bacterium]
MDVVEQLDAWEAHYKANFLAHYEATGETNFKQYEYVRNEETPSGKAIELSASKLAFITSSGAYLKDSQDPYDAEHALGDYTTRPIPQGTPLGEIAFAHTHYDHKWVDEDPQALVPLRLLETLQSEGIIGSLADTVISFHGYTPDVTRIVNELVPQVVGMVKDQAADAALLVPA